MDVSKIIKGLEGTLELAEQLLPVAGEVTGLGKIANYVTTGVSIAINVRDRIEESKIVASAREKAAIDAIVKQLADVNDKLAARIAAG